MGSAAGPDTPWSSPQYIHSAGIIHRVGAVGWLAECGARPLQSQAGQLLSSHLPALQDLKPSNVAVNEDCELRVSARGGEPQAAGRGMWGC